MQSIIENLHRNRLQEKNIVIEDLFLDKNHNNEILIRSSDGVRNDNIVNKPRIEKRYFQNQKYLHSETKFNPNAIYTFYFGNNEEDLSCPNCGYNGKVKDFADGCPFCKTNFNMDYTAKNYSNRTIIELIKSKIFFTLTIIISLIIALFRISFLVSQNQTGMAIFTLIFLTPIIFILTYLVATITLIPIVIYRIWKNTYNIDIWKKVKSYGINTTEKSFFNSLISELLKYYYDSEKAPQYKDLIDFDIISYNKFDFFKTKDSNYHMITEYKIRKVYFRNNKIITSTHINKVKLKWNKIFDQLRNGSIVIQCENCGASIDISNKECQYCRTPIDFKNEWSIEEFIADNS